MDDKLEDNLIEAYQTQHREEDTQDYKSRLDRIRELLAANPPPEAKGGYVLIIRKDKTPRWHMLNSDNTIIGRGDSVGLVLEHPWISSEHCQITYDKVDWYIKDLNSKNGILINEKEKSFHYLNEGDAIEIGDYLLIFITV